MTVKFVNIDVSTIAAILLENITDTGDSFLLEILILRYRNFFSYRNKLGRKPSSRTAKFLACLLDCCLWRAFKYH